MKIGIRKCKHPISQGAFGKDPPNLCIVVRLVILNRPFHQYFKLLGQFRLCL